MKSEARNLNKELYNQLRCLSCSELWEVEVARFDKATPQERMERVAVVRAVGVVFSESGTVEEKSRVRRWLLHLLHDPCEKIRRYAMAALPKVDAGPIEEAELLSLFQRDTTCEREKKFLGQALDKIGGTSTLETMKNAPGSFHLQTEQKVKAGVARRQSPSAVRMDAILAEVTGLRIHLRGRKGLERMVREEVEEFISKHGQFRITGMSSGLVTIIPLTPFKLADIYTLRCFGVAGFVLGTVPISDETEAIEALATVISSPLSRRLLKTFTQGSIRYRLDFVAKGHLRGVVRLLANRAYALCPEILNDAQNAPWAIDIHSTGRGYSVELRPRLAPDPRFHYRQHDVPASSHPPLAACMARLAGKINQEIVWDPFCGSGLELIERAILGGVRGIYGTDCSAAAIAIAETNFAAAKVKSTQAKFFCCDFRDFSALQGLGPGTVTLVITNPPMGKRVPIGNLRHLIDDLFTVAARMLRPGGRLVFANPLRMEKPTPLLKLQSRQVVDFGGFDCRLELYLKSM